MNTNDILTLAKAGFTAQQIAALSQLTTATATATDTAPVAPTSEAPIAQPQPAPVPTPTPTPTPAPAPAAAQAPATADDVLKAMQQMMLLQTQQPKQPTAEDILAEIINPPLLNKEE